MKYIKRATRLALSCLSTMLAMVLAVAAITALPVAVLAFTLSILADHLAE